jgi:hypothetical protein
VADAMFEAVRQLEDPECVRIEEEDIHEETLRYVEQFADERWTWRR